jgi:hypothetical protein
MKFLLAETRDIAQSISKDIIPALNKKLLDQDSAVAAADETGTWRF